MRPVGSAEELERRRRRAITLLEQGERPAVIIRVLGISKTSFYRWRKAALHGEDGLSAKVREGNARLTVEQFAVLAMELRKGAMPHGWPNALWTGERVAVLVERLFHVRYTPDHIRVLLREKLGWTSQKPEKRGRERDEAEIDRWRKEEFPRIKKRQKARRSYRLSR
jgi:transposase